MLDVVAPARLEDVEKPGPVAVQVGVGVLQRIAHAGLCGQMDDLRDLGLREQRIDRRLVGDVDRAQIQAAAQGRDPVMLDLRIVVVVKVVDADHGIAAREQAARHVGADEAGCAGEQNRHAPNPDLRRSGAGARIVPGEGRCWLRSWCAGGHEAANQPCRAVRHSASMLSNWPLSRARRIKVPPPIGTLRPCQPSR